MKKLSLALAVFTLTACGSTAKNEVTKGIPLPQLEESQDAYKVRCANGYKRGAPRGIPNADGSMCKMIVGSFAIAGETAISKITDESISDGTALPAGSIVMGGYDGGTLAPEVMVNGSIEQRGNISSALTLRDGEVKIRVYPGLYKTLFYTTYVCTARGQGYISCQGF